MTWINRLRAHLRKIFSPAQQHRDMPQSEQDLEILATLLQEPPSYLKSERGDHKSQPGDDHR